MQIVFNWSPVLSAFLIALREGVEAALVVGIVLVYLARTGRTHLSRYVWGGVAAAVALSLAVAIALDRFNISEDGFEGLMYLVAAFFVVTMVWWMNSVAKHLRKEIEEKVEKYAGREGSAAGWGIGLFVFLMVLREGAELALILRAVEISTEGLETWIGTVAGIAAAVAVGLFFFKGTLKVPLQRFFAVTSSILVLVAIQLAVTGLHELSEARWIPSSKAEMAILGPIVRNELFFFIFVFGAVIVMIFREWQNARHAKPPAEAMNDAERRLMDAKNRRQRRWMMAAAIASLAVILALTADFIYAQVNAAPPPARPVQAVNNRVRIPIAQVQDGNMHLFTLTANGQSIRFMVIKKPSGYGTALDACLICGAEGYRQEGQNVICRHCASAIYIPSIGQKGGCNPIGFPSQVDGEDIVIDVSAVTKAAEEIPR
ncbi:MAG TPA: Fe-S-containing protein [Candidatus Sulfotelmatobacter sp.]|nr:Fe-S-containing protein [Candidatus Sulfotelmatobacter sp.]